MLEDSVGMDSIFKMLPKIYRPTVYTEEYQLCICIDRITIKMLLVFIYWF